MRYSQLAIPVDRRSGGYTLVELLLYVVMIGLLLTTVTQFFGMSVDTRVKSQSIAEVNDQGVAAMDYISRTVRNANSISSPAAASNGSSLTLVVPTSANSPTVFDISGTTLQVKEGSAAAVALTSNDVQISNFTVRNLTRSGTPGVVQISFTVSRTNPNNRNAFEYQKSFTTTAEVAW